MIKKRLLRPARCRSFSPPSFLGSLPFGLEFMPFSFESGQTVKTKEIRKSIDGSSYQAHIPSRKLRRRLLLLEITRIQSLNRGSTKSGVESK